MRGHRLVGEREKGDQEMDTSVALQHSICLQPSIMYAQKVAGDIERRSMTSWLVKLLCLSWNWINEINGTVYHALDLKCLSLEYVLPDS